MTAGRNPVNRAKLPGSKWTAVRPENRERHFIVRDWVRDADGRPVYDWTLVDRIFDTWVERGMRPLVEIGFMPEDLSSRPDPYRHRWAPDRPYDEIYTGWTYPPDDYGRWANLVYAWVAHSVERYGREEVERWHWEPWNEPDIGYWRGTTEEYLKLYDYTVDAVLRALCAAAQGVLRGQDRLGRWGGEEWLLVMPGTRGDELQAVFARLRLALAGQRVPGLPHPHGVTFSMGTAERSAATDSVDALIAEADRHLYRAKAQGRDALCGAAPPDARPQTQAV